MNSRCLETSAGEPCPYHRSRNGLCALHFALELCQEEVWEDRASLAVIGPITCSKTALVELARACVEVWDEVTPIASPTVGGATGIPIRAGEVVGAIGTRSRSARLTSIRNRAERLVEEATPRLAHELKTWLDFQDGPYLARLCRHLEASLDELLVIAE
jgi:hypothetical protein